jgi:hypothetical protein
MKCRFVILALPLVHVVLVYYVVTLRQNIVRLKIDLMSSKNNLIRRKVILNRYENPFKLQWQTELQVNAT